MKFCARSALFFKNQVFIFWKILEILGLSGCAIYKLYPLGGVGIGKIPTYLLASEIRENQIPTYLLAGPGSSDTPPPWGEHNYNIKPSHSYNPR